MAAYLSLSVHRTIAIHDDQLLAKLAQKGERLANQKV